MSVEILKNYLINNPEEIIRILELTDFHSISLSNNRKEIRCSYYEGGNPTSVYITCSDLKSYVFSKGIGGDLFNLIKIHNNWTFNQTINFILNVLNIKDLKNIENNFVFNGAFVGFKKEHKDKKTFLSKDILLNYMFHPNYRFLKDNISLLTQYKFNIRYDNKTNRIIVPWFDINGNLVGITGRYNFNELGKNPKWKAMENFSKGKFLYGIYENFDDIKKSEYVIIGESEKFVMQLDSYGYHNGLALGSCNITEAQSRIIKSLPVKKIILAFDEGVDIEHILNQCEKLKGGIFNNSKEIWCIYNNDNSILPKGSKASPTDFGKDKFELLLNKYCFRKE